MTPEQARNMAFLLRQVGRGEATEDQLNFLNNQANWANYDDATRTMAQNVGIDTSRGQAVAPAPEAPQGRTARFTDYLDGGWFVDPATGDMLHEDGRYSPASSAQPDNGLTTGGYYDLGSLDQTQGGLPVQPANPAPTPAQPPAQGGGSQVPSIFDLIPQLRGERFVPGGENYDGANNEYTETVWDWSDFQPGASSLDGGGGYDPNDYAFDRYVPGEESPWGVPEIEGGNKDFYRNQFVSLLRDEQNFRNRQMDAMEAAENASNDPLFTQPMDFIWRKMGVTAPEIMKSGYASPIKGQGFDSRDFGYQIYEMPAGYYRDPESGVVYVDGQPVQGGAGGGQYPGRADFGSNPGQNLA